MPPKQVKKKKEEPEASNRSKSASTRGAKRSGETEEEEEEEKGADESMTSFMDMSDDIHINIFTKLDLPSSLQLRVNKRLDRLHLSVKKNLKRLEMRIGVPFVHLTIDHLDSVRIRNFTQLEQGLRKSALNTFIGSILIVMDTEPNEDHSRILDALSQFKAHYFTIQNIPCGQYILAHLPLSSVLTLAQNVALVEIRVECTSLTTQDLEVIRKTMLEGACSMKTFLIWLHRGRMTSFLNDCLGVVIERVSFPVRGKIYRCADDSLEIYKAPYSYHTNSDLLHFEGDLRTTVYEGYLLFAKDKAKPSDQFKIRPNHLYAD